MNEEFNKIDEQIKWKNNFHTILKQLESGENISTPLSVNEAECNFYITQAIEYMNHNEEKYRDKDGKEFYSQIQNFIDSLKK